MRTRFELVLCAETSDRSEAVERHDLRAAGEEALAEIEQVESWLSAYRPDSALFQINAAAGQDAVRVDARIFAFLQTIRDLSLATEGAFDPTIGSIVELWRTMRKGQTVPEPDAISEQLGSIGIQTVLEVDAEKRMVRLTRPGARLDAGAVGKGYALDRAADRLREAGVHSALLHGGTSSVVAIGAPPESMDGWPIAIQNPVEKDAYLTTVVLKDQSLGVSTIYGRTFGHVLDPRTGQPVEKTVLAACIYPTATVADALSTALLVAGREGMSGLSRRFPDASFLVVEQGPDGSLSQTKTGAHFAPRNGLHYP